MSNKIALESLAMDLKRVALGYHRGSTAVAERFYREACQRAGEVDLMSVKPYLQKILYQVQTLQERDGESALLYSTLIQNYTQTFFR